MRSERWHIISKSKSKPANFIGKTNLLQLAALISRCKVYITPDSAPLHVAAAMGHPLIIEFLIKSGADLATKNKHGQRPVDCAKNKKTKELIESCKA